MATHDDVPMNPEYMDYAEHERTYRMFTAMVKNIAIGLAVLLVLMAFFLL